MALTAKMVDSEILVCGIKAGVKQIPIVGEMAVHVVENLQKRHEAMNNAAQMAEFNAKLTRVELAMCNTVEEEIRKILTSTVSDFGATELLSPKLFATPTLLGVITPKRKPNGGSKRKLDLRSQDIRND